MRKLSKPETVGSNPSGPAYNRSFLAGINTGINTAPLSYVEVRDGLASWLKANYSKRYTLGCLAYLDKYLKGSISSPQNLVAIESQIERGRRNFCLAVRVLLNYLETTSMVDEDSLFRYRKAVRIPQTGSDDFVPETDYVAKTYGKIGCESYKIVYKLIFYSGIRSIEAVQMLSNYDPRNLMTNRRVARYPLNMVRGTKRAIYAYFPLGFSRELRAIPDCGKVAGYFRSCHGRLPLKYLRKWHYNFLISQGVPESVTDFIQGRALSSVGSMHYLAKAKQADDWYSRIIGEFPTLPSGPRRGTS